MSTKDMPWISCSQESRFPMKAGFFDGLFGGGFDDEDGYDSTPAEEQENLSGSDSE